MHYAFKYNLLRTTVLRSTRRPKIAQGIIFNVHKMQMQ